MNKNLRVSLIVLLVTTAWFASGMWRTSTVEEPAAVAGKKRSQVTASWFQAKPYVASLVARAITQPNREVMLRAEVSGRVVDVLVQEGEQVKAGELICRLSEEDRARRVVEAESVLREAELKHRGALKLQKQGYQSELAIATTKADMERARADVTRRKLDLQNTEIRAPFDGVVEERPAEIGDYLERGSVCAELLDVSRLKVVAQLSERKVQQVAIDSLARIILDDETSLEGKVTYIAQKADNITRTYRVEVKVENPGLRLRAGLPADLRITSKPIMAHRIPSSLLRLADSGEIEVRALDEKNRVQSRTIRIIGEQADGVWVMGLPERALLITVGQEYVVAGEEVEVTVDEQFSGLATR